MSNASAWSDTLAEQTPLVQPGTGHRGKNIWHAFDGFCICLNVFDMFDKIAKIRDQGRLHSKNGIHVLLYSLSMFKLISSSESKDVQSLVSFHSVVSKDGLGPKQ